MRNKFLEEAKNPSNSKTPIPQVFDQILRAELKGAGTRLECDDKVAELPKLPEVQEAMYRSRMDTMPKAPTALSE